MTHLARQKRQSLETVLGLLEDEDLCPYCLGSLLATFNRRVSSWILGYAILSHISESGGVRGPRASRGLSGECSLCGGLLPRSAPKLTYRLIEELSNYEFESFKGGAVLPAYVHEAHDEIRGKRGIWTAESPKVTVSRFVDDIVSAVTGARIDPARPDLVGLIDLSREAVEIQVNPVYVGGRYLKLVRGISQSRWICPSCGGAGCEECEWTGFRFGDSVEHLIGEPAKKAFEAEDYKLHAAGREDVDARMLGTGRPFVLELVRPRRRRVNLSELEEDINRSAGGKIRVINLQYADHSLVKLLKEGAPQTRKVYRAIVEVDSEVSDDELKKVAQALEGALIEQRTPTRVLRRRADMVRRKRVYRVEVKRLSENSFEIIVECDGGLYVKELVSGDEGRTRPSVASILGKKAFCRELDVLAVLTPYI